MPYSSEQLKAVLNRVTCRKDVNSERKEKCPICGHESLVIRVAEHDIPYFGRVAIVSERCGKCGYFHNDIYCQEVKEPRRYEYEVSSPEDMSVRVIRSRYGIIRIPELGVEITPGPLAEAFVSNIEGVLERVAYIIEDFLLWEEDETVKNKAREVLDLIDRVKRGEYKVTLIIEDPTGNSAIIPPPEMKSKLKVSLLSEEATSQ